MQKCNVGLLDEVVRDLRGNDVADVLGLPVLERDWKAMPAVAPASLVLGRF